MDIRLMRILLDDNSNKTIEDKLEALRNLKLEDEGLLRAREFHQIIKAQMDVTALLFERQHKDIEKLSRSSRILEILTGALIGLTGVLIVLTIVLSDNV